MRRIARSGLTLMELMLALALTAVVAALIGGLVQLFLSSEHKGRENVRQAQLARSILNMIADDIRTTVRHQTFDTSGLQQMLNGSGGGGAMGGGGAGGGGASAVGGASSGGASAVGGAAGAGAAGGSGAGASSGSASSTATSSMTPPMPPPGIYGSTTSIEIDVSRLPRPDEYYYQAGDMSRGTLGDMPSDIKTIGYYVQASGANGVQDPLAGFSAETSDSGGLVRRSIDRAITQYAYSLGRSDQLLRTGQIVAPEVLAIEFNYHDGTTWLTQWDSSQQGLPRVVKVTIAMQSEAMATTNRLKPGISIASINASMIRDYGIRIYSINTIIPGAQLLVAPQGTTTTGSSGNGMGAMGL